MFAFAVIANMSRGHGEKQESLRATAVSKRLPSISSLGSAGLSASVVITQGFLSGSVVLAKQEETL